MHSEQVIETLRKCELFDGLTDDELRTIARAGSVEEYPAGAKIYAQGSMGTQIYVLVSGQVSLEREAPEGLAGRSRITVFVQRETPSRRIMGGWAALVGEAHVQMCTARCDRTATVVAVPCADLRAIMVEDVAVRVKILEKLVLMLRERIVSSYQALETL